MLYALATLPLRYAYRGQSGCSELIEKLHHRDGHELATATTRPLRSPQRRAILTKKSESSVSSSLTSYLLLQLSLIVAETASAKRDQPADNHTDDSAAKKQKVEEAPKMSALRLGSVAPDFEAKTTQGPIKFHDFIDGSWAILFSCVGCSLPSCSSVVPAGPPMEEALILPWSLWDRYRAGQPYNSYMHANTLPFL